MHFYKAPGRGRLTYGLFVVASKEWDANSVAACSSAVFLEDARMCGFDYTDRQPRSELAYVNPRLVRSWFKNSNTFP